MSHLPKPAFSSYCHKKQIQLVLLICRFHQQQINNMGGGDILESSKKQNLNWYALATQNLHCLNYFHNVYLH